MELWTTPEQYGSRDHELFPALDLVCQRYGVPSSYEIEVTPMWVGITVGDFYLEEPIRLRLILLYEAYLNWWCDWHNQHVWVARELGMPGYLLGFRIERGVVEVPLPPGSLPGKRQAHDSGGILLRGEVALIVLPEHAQWWIDLLNETAPFLEERARLFPTRADEEEQKGWEYESIKHAESPARISH